ncbi:MAG: hypothetical protein FIA99_16015, partial [Ruminiclostridium sp.]|nr:hypothetical protein [Ruminiclostridium sp.]
MIKLEKTNNGVFVSCDKYDLKYDDKRPYFISIVSREGGIKADLFIPSGFHMPDANDVTSSLDGPSVAREADCFILEFTVKSNIWNSKKCIFKCDEQGVDYYI